MSNGKHPGGCNGRSPPQRLLGRPMQGLDRQRGVFPLPVLKSESVDVQNLSRACSRRVKQRDRVDDWVNDIVSSLNSMYLGEELMADFDPACKPNLAQRRCLDRIRESVLKLGKPPSDVSGQGALSELRASMGYSGEPASLANFRFDLVSLPPTAGSPSSLESILGSEGAEILMGILRSKILDSCDVDAKLKGSNLKRPYYDPCLRKRGIEYQQFVRRLHNANLIDFRLSIREEAGLFVVWKKSGKQRLVVDARRSNCWFDSPLPVKLATGGSFAQIEVDNAGPIELAGIDIADAFYGIELPHEFRDLFGLAPLTADQAGISEVQGRAVHRQQVVYPVFRVVPMGWTHALWVCQQCHEHVVNTIESIPSSLRFHDGAPIPALRPLIHTEYVDNYVAISQVPGAARASAREVERSLNERGLPTHAVEEGVGGETLGWKFGDNSAEVTMTPRRLWKLRLAVVELLSQGWATGKLLEKIVGHLTFASLLRRELLSCFQATYVYIKKCYHVHSRIWPQVVRELKWACSLLPLVCRNMAAPWSSEVLATDASHWGRGVAKLKSSVERVRAQARVQDRWRFTREQESLVLSSHDLDPLIHALTNNDDPCSDDAPPNSDNLKSLPVPELDVEFLAGPWTRVESRPWIRHEHIVILEGRALVWAVQHLARSSRNHGCRHLLLSDSMSCVLALTKGRGSSSGMNRICRQIAALSLACDFHLFYRWCPSELNPADKPSRNKILGDYNIWDNIDELVNAEACRESRHSWRRQAAAFYAGCRNGGKNWECCARRRAEIAGWREPEAAESDQSCKPDSPAWESTPPSSQGHSHQNILGRKDYHDTPHEIIRSGLGKTHAFCQTTEVSNEHIGAGGCGSSLVDGCLVLRRGRGVRGNDHDGSNQAHENRCPSLECPGQMQQGSPILSSSCTTPGQSANSVSNACPDDHAHCQPAQPANGGGAPCPHLEPVLPPRRIPEVEVPPAGGSKPSQQEVVSDPFRKLSNRRQVTTLKDTRAGRGSDDRPSLHAVVGDGSKTFEEQGELKAERVRFRHGPCDQALASGCRRMWFSSTWNPVCVPDQAWFSINRPAHSTEVGRRVDEARPLEEPQQSPPLRAGWEALPGLWQPQCSAAKSSPQGRKAAAQYFGPLRWMLKAPKRSIFLELFSGSGRLSKAIRHRSHRTFQVVEIDIETDPQHDLSKRALQNFLVLLIKLDKIAAVWMDTPCTSWSLARRNDGQGPPPLRSDEQLWGLSGLSLKDKERVRLGNNLARFSFRIFRFCHQLCIPAAIENPSTSRLWLIRPAQQIQSYPDVHLHVTDYCQDGTPWRKRTKVLTCHIDFSLVPRLCTSHKGICSHTNKPHVQLCGQQYGQFLTLLAQPYPKKLCNRIATVFHSAMLESLSRPMMKLVGF